MTLPLNSASLKDQGNIAYKNKDFPTALSFYDQAIKANPNDLVYYSNKAAVLIEMGECEEAVTLLTNALDKRQDILKINRDGASYEKCAKVYNRIASAYTKMDKINLAIEAYKKSLTEDNNRSTRTLLRDLETLKQNNEKEAYLNPEKAEEHRLAGNEYFKQGNYAAGKKEYDEAILRNPKDPKLFSNRAACYTKLLAFPDALKDLDICIALDPKFIKAYSRRGMVYSALKDFNKSLNDYNKGLELDPSNKECLIGRDAVMDKINQSMNSSDAPDKDQIARAMADPEIQSILKDPQMSIVLQNMQENPSKGMEAMKDPQVAKAIQKLIAAGILKVGDGSKNHK